MKIPQRPPDGKTAWDEHQNEINDLLNAYYNTLPKGSKDIRELVRKYNDTEYIHWDELRRKKLPRDPVLIWTILKILRENDYIKLEIGKVLFFYIVLRKFLKQLHLIDKASPASLDRLLDGSLAVVNRQQYLISSLMEEAIASSQLEGAATTRQIAKKILREGKKPRTHSERMIVNNYRTINMVREKKDLSLTPDLILEIHREITLGTLEDEMDENQFRTTDDIVVRDKRDPTLIYYHPPKAAEIPAMIEGLCTFANSDDEFIHPILKAIIIHFLIGYIHPFNDGNGRTARALFYWYVLKNRYDLFEYLSISRIFVNAPAKYTQAYLLTETDFNDMTYFIDFNIGIISRAMDDLKQYIERKQREQRESIKIVDQIPDLSFRQAEILKDIIKHPDRPYSVGEIAGKYKVSLQTARSDLLFLEQIGKVRKFKMGKGYAFIKKRDEAH